MSQDIVTITVLKTEDVVEIDVVYPQGPVGPAGPAGPQGPAGPAGDDPRITQDEQGNPLWYGQPWPGGSAPGVPPVVTSSQTANAAVGQAFTYQIVATNSPTSYNATDLPAGLSVDLGTGLISGTPTTEGSVNSTISASNGSGTGTAPLHFAILPLAPVITSPTTANTNVGEPISYQITATHSPTVFGATGLPSGLSIDTDTGLITGNLIAEATTNVDISATNARGTGHQNLSIVVGPALELHHGVGWGQSLVVGMDGWPVVSTSQSFGNLMLDGGVRAKSGGMNSLIPLVAAKEADDLSGYDGETIANGFADSLAAAQSYRSFVMSISGLSGATYDAIKKGTAVYNRLLAQVQAVYNLADPIKYRGVRFVLQCHGESDQAFEVPNYYQKPQLLRTDLQADINSINSRGDTLVALIYQQCSYPPQDAASLSVATAYQATLSHKTYPSQVVCVGPNYPYVRSDGIHLTAKSYRALGALYQRVAKKILAGQTWDPLMPVSVIRTGLNIDVMFNKSSLVLDDVRMFNPGNYGFSLQDDTAVVTGVSVLSPNTVRVTIDQTPTNPSPVLRYGWFKTNWVGGNGGPKGPMGSPRGCLRDAGEGPDMYGYDTYNWCVLFNEPIT